MPYFSIEDLPVKIRNYLPKNAQEIYRKAFNKTWDLYRNPKSIPKDFTRVELAAIVAWIAVKKHYKKGKRKWRKRTYNHSD